MATTITRAAWRGYITLGKLGIPVRLYAAIQSIRPQFVQLHETDGSPVERELRCRAEQRKIDNTEVVRAIEYEPGHYVTFTDDELTASNTQPTKTISIQQFCSLEDIPTIYFDKSFYIVPAKGGEHAYALLREALVRQQKVAVAQIIMHAQEHIIMLGVHGDVLLLQQLHFASEIIPRTYIKTPALPKPSPAELEVVGAVVERFSGPLYLGDYHDEYSEQIRELVDRKSRGLKGFRRERIAAYTTQEADIISALQDTLGEKKLIADSMTSP